MSLPDVMTNQEWQRLDRRMLLIGPVRALKELAIPLIITAVGISSRDSASAWWLIPGIIGLLVIGVVPWFTTTFRMTSTQFQLRKGLLNKQQLTAPLDRIRSVDLESSLLHRLLGLAKVEIGTGVDDSRIELNALAEPQAQSLRVALLSRAPEVAPTTPGADEVLVSAEAPLPLPQQLPVPPLELARIDWSWLRFAPFSLGRLVLLAGIFGVVSQFGDELPIFDWDALGSGWDRVQTYALPVVILVGFVSATIAWLLVSIGGYVVQWWNLRLVRENGSLRLTAGLFTTRSTSIEEERIRGVELTEPGLLRLVGGAELSTLATGVGDGGTTTVLPQCPREVATRVGEAILDLRDPEDTQPLSVPLIQHGRAALRRCYINGLDPLFTWTLVGGVLVWFDLIPVWVLASVAIALAAFGVFAARAAYAHLGHALTADHLVAGDGMFRRRRIALETEGVIGWVVQQTWFQRRVGLATLVATTAAGSESVEIKDVPHEIAIALADTVTPGVLTPFLS